MEMLSAAGVWCFDEADWHYDNPPSLSVVPMHFGWYVPSIALEDTWTPQVLGGSPVEPAEDHDPVVFADVSPPLRESDLRWLQSGVLQVSPGTPTGGGRRGPRLRDRLKRDRRGAQGGRVLAMEALHYERLVVELQASMARRPRVRTSVVAGRSGGKRPREAAQPARRCPGDA